MKSISSVAKLASFPLFTINYLKKSFSFYNYIIPQSKIIFGDILLKF